MAARICTQGVKAGLPAGLAATVVVDAIMMSVLRLRGEPARTGFVLIGDTAARFLSRFRIKAAGGAPLGLFFHFLIGMAFGGLFGGMVSCVPALRASSKPKVAGLGILYTELISIPILVLPPIILKMSKPDKEGWFRFTIPLHAVFGVVLGLVVRSRLNVASGARPPDAKDVPR